MAVNIHCRPYVKDVILRVWAVSYTHLDVYKRQLICCPILKYILANLNQWLGEEDVDYTHRSDIYDETPIRVI